MSVRLGQWLDSVFEGGGRLYMKRLAGNDTLLTAAHQAGPYVPKKVIFDLFPTLQHMDVRNPRVRFQSVIVSDNMPAQDVSAIWYNNKVIGDGTRDECRITGWGGAASPLLDPESTGSIAALCFKGQKSKDAEACEIWVCSSVEEEDLLENRFGPIEPGSWLYLSETSARFYSPTLPLSPVELRDSPSVFEAYQDDPAQLSLVLGRPVDRDCRLSADQIPAEWITVFPSGEAIVDKAVSLRPSYARLPPDKRLLKRRDCEYEVFLSAEEQVVLPVVQQGFVSVDQFINLANSVTNRRKARSGRSLELQAKRIFDEENLTHYSHDEISEGQKRPDFLFPSAAAYHDPRFPKNELRMLAAKTTCKDRWRQVTDEAARIELKHLLTLQEGVTEAQYDQMQRAGIRLVVPKPLHSKYPKSLRHKLMTFADFILEVRNLHR